MGLLVEFLISAAKAVNRGDLLEERCLWKLACSLKHRYIEASCESHNRIGEI